MNSFRHLLLVSTGFDSTNVLLVRPDAISAGHRGPRATQFFNELLDRVNSLANVQSAALSWAPPVSRGMGNNGNISIEGHTPGTGEDRVVWSNFVTPGYFPTIGQTLLAGRDFTKADRQGAPRVAIINQSMARYFWGNESPIGRKIDSRGENNYDCEIIGVVAAYAFSHVISSLLFGITARDAVSFAGAVVVLALAALIATIVPARRAAKVDPMEALRHE